MNRLYTHIAVRGGYGYANFGDDCLMVACHEILKRSFAQSEYAFLCNDLEYPCKLVPGIRTLPNIMEVNIKCDLLLFGGGTQFYSFPKPLSWYWMKGSYAFSHPKEILSRLYGAYTRQTSIHGGLTAALGIGFGPFARWSIVSQRAKKLARNLDFLAVRDVASASLCKNWGVKSFIHRSDLCFWPSLMNSFGLQAASSPRSSFRSLGLIVRDWKHDIIGDSYHTQAIDVARRAQNLGLEVSFILFAGAKDAIWSSRIRTEFPVLSWDPYRFAVSAFLDELNRFDILVTARYHGAVFASLLGIPFISIGIEPKLILAAQMLGVGEYIWKFPFNADDCIKLMDRCLTHRDQVFETLCQFSTTQSELAKTMIDEFYNFLNIL